MVQGVVGREAELARLEGFLDRMVEGPTALVLEGEAGIGKTTLFDATTGAATARGYRVLAARAAQPEARLSFAAFTDLLDSVAPEVLPNLPDPQRRAVEIALLRLDPGGRPPDHRTVCAGFASAIATLASDTPVLIAVDDVQWLDRPSARVLEFAARRLGDRRVGLLVSARASDRSELPFGLSRALPDRRVDRLRLGPVSLAVLHHVIRERLDVSFLRPQMLRIERASGGNPFFALELARDIAKRGTRLGPGGAVPIPQSVMPLVAGRISALPATARKALVAAAVLVDPSLPAIRSLTNNRGRLAGLGSAEVSGVVEIKDGRVRFTHPLLGSAAYASASEERRRRLHLKAAALAIDPEERAQHLALTAKGPSAAIAAALDVAAEWAESRGAPDRAAELWEAAAGLTPGTRTEGRWRRAVRAAECYFQSGDNASARPLLEGVIAVAQAGPLRADALRALSMVQRRDGLREAAEGSLRQASAEAGNATVTRARIELSLAYAVAWRRGLALGLRHAETTQRLLDEAAEPGLAGAATALVFHLEYSMGREVRWDRLSDALALEATTLERGHTYLPVDERPSYFEAWALREADEQDRARERFEELRRTCADRGEEGSLAFLLHLMAELETSAGNFSLAARHADEATEVMVRSGLRQMESVSLYVRAHLEARQGKVAAARTHATRALEIATRAGSVPSIHDAAGVLGFLALSIGDHLAADRLLTPAITMMVSLGVGDPAALRSVPDEIEALVTLGELGRAEALLDPFEQQASFMGRRWAAAAASRCRALVCSGHGDLAAAVGAADRAVDGHRELPYPFELGRSLLVQGVAHRRRKEKAVAAEAFREAVEIFDRLGTPLWADKARAEIRRVGLRPRAPLELTATEARVAELAASGLTNREVADALFVSPKTVESNLAKVYRKLGIRSRAELGATIAARERVAAKSRSG